MIQSKNLVSKEYTGNTVLSANQNRSYFFIGMTSGTGTIEFGGGGGQIPLAEGAFYEPYVATTGEISVVTTGTFIINQG